MDHLFVRHIEDVEAAVNAYKSLGIRVFLALMLGDTARDDQPFANYTACAVNAHDRNADAAARGCACGGFGPLGALREAPNGRAAPLPNPPPAAAAAPPPPVQPRVCVLAAPAGTTRPRRTRRRRCGRRRRSASTAPRRESTS